MSIILADSYSESNYDESYSGFYGIAQSFIGNGDTLDSVKFFLARQAAVVGNVTAQIYAHSGTFGTSSVPTGSALAISDTVDASTLQLLGSFRLDTFTFTGDQRITLVDGTPYILAFINGIANVLIGDDGSSPTHGGNLSYNVNGVSGWNAESGTDLIFYLYTETQDSPIIGNRYPLPPFRVI